MAESFVFRAKFDYFLVLDALTFFIYIDDLNAFSPSSINPLA